MLQIVVLGIDWFVPCQPGLSFLHIGKSSYVKVLWHSGNPKIAYLIIICVTWHLTTVPKVAGFVPSLVSPYIGMKK